MKIKGIVFDKDGTLIDYESCWVERTKAATKRLLARHKAEEAYDNIMKKMGILEDGTVDISGALCHGTYRSITDDYINEITLLGINVDTEQFYRELRADFDFYKYLSESCPTVDGLFELLSGLKNRGIKLGLVTTDDLEGARRTLEPLGVFEIFDMVLSSDTAHPRKPDPYSMKLFMKETGLGGDEILMVGDTATDMQFGKNAGTYTLGVAKTEKNRKILEPLADFVAKDISVIPELIK